MSAWISGGKWSVKLVHLPSERDRSPVTGHVKVDRTDALRSEKEPECWVLHRPASWQWGAGASTDDAEVLHWKEEGLG